MNNAPKQHQHPSSSQPHPHATSRRLRSVPHDAAATLYGEMSHIAASTGHGHPHQHHYARPHSAAAAAAAAAGQPPSPSSGSIFPAGAPLHHRRHGPNHSGAPLIPSPHLGASQRGHGAPVTSSVAPPHQAAAIGSAASPTSNPNQPISTASASPITALPASTAASNAPVAAPQQHPLFYIHSIAPAHLRGTCAGHSLSLNAANPLDADSCGSSAGRNSPASAVATAVSPSATGSGSTGGRDGAASLLGSSLNTTPPQSSRGLAASPLHSSTGSVYTRHTAAAAPWTRLHRPTSNFLTRSVSCGHMTGMNAQSIASMGSRKSSVLLPGQTLSNTGVPAAASAVGACSLHTPATMTGITAGVGGGSSASKVATNTNNINLSASVNVAQPGTPVSAADPSHQHRGTSEDDTAALTMAACPNCLNAPCVCGRDSGLNGAGLHALSMCGSRACGGLPWAAALALHRPQQQILGTALGSAASTATTSGAAAAATTTVAAAPFSLVPPFRTARVESGVYRGAYPVLRNFPYLRRLKLRTIVSLIPEPPTYDLKCFTEAEGIQLRHIHAERSKGEVQLLPSELSEALQLILDSDLHPMYVHCLDGRHVTGLIMMGLRKLQQWDLRASHAEYLRFTREVQDEESFIADYNGPLQVPPHIPSWIWGGSLLDPATGQPKRSLPTAVRLRLTTVAPAGSSSAVAGPVPHSAAANAGSHVQRDGAAGGPLASGESESTEEGRGATLAPTATKATAFAALAAEQQPRAVAPWMTVAGAETMAADGQRYLDVDRVRGAAALYSDANGGYSNVPMLFSFGCAAGAGADAGAKDGHGSVTAASSAATSGAVSPTCAHSGSVSRRGSAGPPSQPARARRHTPSVGATPGGPHTDPASAAAVNPASGTAGQTASSSSEWVMTAPLDALQPPPSPYRMQPPSPNATASREQQQNPLASTAAFLLPTAGGGNPGADGSSSCSLFGSQLSALMWTSGLTAPPTPRTPAVGTVRAPGAGAAAGCGGGGGGGGGNAAVSAGASGVTGAAGVSGPANPSGASGATALLGPCVSAATRNSGAPANATKRSYSR